MKLEIIENSPFYKSLICSFDKFTGVGVLELFVTIAEKFNLDCDSEIVLWEEVYSHFSNELSGFTLEFSYCVEIHQAIKSFDYYSGVTEGDLKLILKDYLSQFLANCISLGFLQSLKLEMDS